LVNKIIERVREMDAASDKYDFPEIAGDHTFSSTDIYWARGKGGGEGAEEVTGLELLLQRTQL
jgi:hypothetical protein